MGFVASGALLDEICCGGAYLYFIISATGVWLILGFS